MSAPIHEPLNKSVEQDANGSIVPVLLIALFALLLYWGMVYLDDHGGSFRPEVYAPYASYAELVDVQPQDHVDPVIKLGKAMYQNCVACHQSSALGVAGQFPPLAGSDWVNAKGPDRMIRIVLNGLQGPINVNGQSYNNVMVPWKETLSDEQIAAVITYVRQNKEWNNNASAVTPAQVKTVRDLLKTRNGAFTPDELLKIPVDK